MVAADKRVWIPIVSSFIISFSYFLSHFFCNDIRDAIEIFHWLEAPKVREARRVSTYNFDITPTEFTCQYGSIDDGSSLRPPIPNVAHFIIGLHDAELSFPAYLSIQSTLQMLRPDVVKLHHTENLNRQNGHLQKLLSDERVQLKHHDAEVVQDAMRASRHYAHLSDMLRLQILYHEGGIYLDADAYVLQPFDALRRSPCDVVMAHEGGDRAGLTNAIILARPGAAFIRRWIASYADFREDEWNQHSVVLPARMALEPGHESEVCRLSPHTFFWPTWTPDHLHWMHEPLGARGYAATQSTLRANNGSLFEGQMAYHAWNSVAWPKYFSVMNEEVVRTKVTRFNLMVKRFLDQDDVVYPVQNEL